MTHIKCFGMLICDDIPINGSSPLERRSDSGKSHIQTGIILFHPAIPIAGRAAFAGLFWSVLSQTGQSMVFPRLRLRHWSLHTQVFMGHVSVI